MNLTNKTIVITGGGQGLGRSMAVNLAQQGANLALIDLNEELLQETLALVENAGANAKYYLANVTNEQEVEKTFAQINTDFNGIDGLINNAGILRDGMFVKAKEGVVSKKMSLDQFQSVIDVNLTGVFLCGREAAVQMIESGKKGVIINMSSIARGGNMGQTNYAASKAGILGFSKSVALELGSRNIRSNVVAPGFIETEMTAKLDEKVVEGWRNEIPLKRGGTPQDIANACIFLASDMSSYITGQTLSVDGGMLT